MKDERRMLIERLASLSQTPPKSKAKAVDKGSDAKMMEKAIKKAAQLAVSNLSAALERRLDDYEQKFTDLVSRSTADIKRDIALQDSRVGLLEAKLLSLSQRVEELHTDVNKKNESLGSDLAKLDASTKELVETERSKRIAMIKKAQEQNKQQFISTEQYVQAGASDQAALLRDVKDDLRIQSTEVASLKLRFDEISKVGKKVNYMSRSGNGLSADPEDPLDFLLQRLQRLEQHVQGDADGFNDGAPMMRGSMRGGGTHSAQRMRKVEDHLLELQDRIREAEDDIQHVKDSVLNRPTSTIPSSPLRGRGGGLNASQLLDQSFNGAAGVQSHEVKDLERKLKKLAESTTKACKSLSSGLTDIQQSTLTLFAWSDKVHDAFDMVSDKVQLPRNFCPRAKVPSRTRDDDAEYSGRKRI